MKPSGSRESSSSYPQTGSREAEREHTSSKKASPPEGSLTFLTAPLDWKCKVETHDTSRGAFHAQIATVGGLGQTWNTTEVGRNFWGSLSEKNQGQRIRLRIRSSRKAVS